MNISSRDKKILIVFVGLIAAVLSYFLVLSPTLEDNAALESENAQLSAHLSELKEMVTREEEYVSETERMNREVEQILSEFPSYLQTENGIMDVVELEDETGAQVPSLTIADPVLVEITVASDAAQETDSTDSASETATASAASQYSLYDVNTNLSYTSSYAGMKQLIDLIVSDDNKRSVSTFSATFDNSTGEITGAVSFESFFIFGQDKDYVPADIPTMDHGTQNIFGSVDIDTSSSGSSDDDSDSDTDSDSD